MRLLWENFPVPLAVLEAHREIGSQSTLDSQPTVRESCLSLLNSTILPDCFVASYLLRPTFSGDWEAKFKNSIQSAAREQNWPIFAAEYVGCVYSRKPSWSSAVSAPRGLDHPWHTSAWGQSLDFTSESLSPGGGLFGPQSWPVKSLALSSVWGKVVWSKHETNDLLLSKAIQPVTLGRKEAPCPQILNLFLSVFVVNGSN